MAARGRSRPRCRDGIERCGAPRAMHLGRHRAPRSPRRCSASSSARIDTGRRVRARPPPGTSESPRAAPAQPRRATTPPRTHRHPRGRPSASWAARWPRRRVQSMCPHAPRRGELAALEGGSPVPPWRLRGHRVVRLGKCATRHSRGAHVLAQACVRDAIGALVCRDHHILRRGRTGRCAPMLLHQQRAQDDAQPPLHRVALDSVPHASPYGEADPRMPEVVRCDGDTDHAAARAAPSTEDAREVPSTPQSEGACSWSIRRCERHRSRIRERSAQQAERRRHLRKGRWLSPVSARGSGLDGQASPAARPAATDHVTSAARRHPRHEAVHALPRDSLGLPGSLHVALQSPSRRRRTTSLDHMLPASGGRASKYTADG